MVTIGVDQSLSNCARYEHICLEKLISYTSLLTNMIINNRTRALLKHKWSPLLKNLLTIVQCNLSNLWLKKILVQENHYFDFQKHWMLNQRLLSEGYALINENERQSNMELCCVPVYQRDGNIQKSINR